jgi:hypothetical protein
LASTRAARQLTLIPHDIQLLREALAL